MLQSHPETRDRDAIRRACGGQEMAGIGYLSDGFLSSFPEEKESYADGRIPDTGWIAY